MRRISGLKGIQIFKLEIMTIIMQIGVSNMHIHLNLGTRVMLYSLSILVIHRFFNYKQCMVYMQLMSKRDYTICCVCETHYTCLRSKKTRMKHTLIGDS